MGSTRSGSSAVFLALPLLVALAAGGPARGEWNSVASPGFTYCVAALKCAPDSTQCVDIDLGIASDCSALCGVQPPPLGSGICIGVTGSSAEPGWQVSGDGSWSNGGNPFLAAQGELVTPALFVVDATSVQSEVDEADLELSVFRYTGDPSRFDGLRLLSVLDLVDLGFVDRQDILFVTDDFPDGIEQHVFEVDVTGVPADEIVLLSIGREEFSDVPAGGAWGAVTLALLVLAIFTLAWRRRPISPHEG